MEKNSKADNNNVKFEISGKLKKNEDKIKQIKSKQQEYRQYTQLKNRHEMKINSLTNEISNMKTQKVSLMRKIEDLKKKYKADLDERRKEVTRLRKQNLAQTLQLKKLEQSDHKNQLLLKKRLDDIFQKDKKIKEVDQMLKNERKRQPSAVERKKAEEIKKKYINIILELK